MGGGRESTWCYIPNTSITVKSLLLFVLMYITVPTHSGRHVSLTLQGHTLNSNHCLEPNNIFHCTRSWRMLVFWESNDLLILTHNMYIYVHGSIIINVCKL